MLGGAPQQHWEAWEEAGAEKHTLSPSSTCDLGTNGFHLLVVLECPELTVQGPWRLRYLKEKWPRCWRKASVAISQGRVPAFYSKLFLVERASGGWNHDSFVTTQHLHGDFQVHD